MQLQLIQSVESVQTIKSPVCWAETVNEYPVVLVLRFV